MNDSLAPALARAHCADRLREAELRRLTRRRVEAFGVRDALARKLRRAASWIEPRRIIPPVRQPGPATP